MRLSQRSVACITLTAALLPIFVRPLRADIIGFDFSRWKLNQNDTGSPPTIAPGSITITDGGGDEHRGFFYKTPQEISSFSVSFLYSIPVGSATVFDFDPSLAFVIQNSPEGFNLSHYSGTPHSAAVALWLVGNGATGGGSTGVFTGGTTGAGQSTSPVIPTLGDPILIHLQYDGSMLTESLTDTLTNATFSKTYLVDLVGAVGSSTAYIGFTAATDNGGFNPPQAQTLSNFTYHAVPEASSLLMLGFAGSGLGGSLLYRRLKFRT